MNRYEKNKKLLVLLVIAVIATIILAIFLAKDISEKENNSQNVSSNTYKAQGLNTTTNNATNNTTNTTKNTVVESKEKDKTDKSKKEFEPDENGVIKHYEGSYLASYNSPVKIFDNNQNYQIVKDIKTLENILKKLDEKKFDENLFDEDVFTSKNLVVVDGGVTSTLYSFKIPNSTTISIETYYGSPETTQDTKLKHNVFFIPVNKTVTTVDFKTSPYPDRVY